MSEAQTNASMSTSSPGYKRRFKIQTRRIIFFFGLLLSLIVIYHGIQMLRGYTISFYDFPHLSLPPNESTVEKDGLRLTSAGLQREGGKVRISYALEWVPVKEGELQAHFMRPFGRMCVLFWDQNGDEVFRSADAADMDERRTYVRYGVGLAERDSHLCENDALVDLPTRARFLTLRPWDGFATHKMPIP